MKVELTALQAAKVRSVLIKEANMYRILSSDSNQNNREAMTKKADEIADLGALFDEEETETDL